MQRSRIAGLAVTGLVVAGGLVYGFWPKPMAVDLATVERGPLTVTVEEEGRTRVADRYVVSAPVAGYTPRLEAEVGDAVTAGDVLVELEPSPSALLDPRSQEEAEARVSAARAAMEAARQEAEAVAAEANLAASELERYRKLFETGDVTREQLDQSEAMARRAAASKRSAEFAAEAARFELAAARAALDFADDGDGHARRLPVKAPVDGRILAVHHKSEGVVGRGEPLVEIGDPRTLEVEVDVLSADAVRIRSGMDVVLRRWGGEVDLAARVRRVEPAGFTKVSALGVEEQRVLVIADIISPRGQWAERLGDGYRVLADFILWQGDDVLQVPTSALFRHDGGWALFAVRDGEAVLTPVELGHRSGLTAEIADELSPGTPVITHPDDRIRDGVAVAPRD